MLAGVVAALECLRRDVVTGEVGDRIAPRLVQEHDVLAVGDPFCAEADPHAAAERLGEQQPFGQWIGDEEASNRMRRQWSLLPGESHG
jgi:hypothetical protein